MRKGPGPARKLALAALGAFLGLAVLELGLRGAGLAARVLRERASPRGSAPEPARILCLGESTTLGASVSYPEELERILNAESARRFTVFNLGVAGTTSSEIAARLDADLDRYRPDIIAVMMGANDGPSPWARTLRSALPLHLERLKTVRLLQLSLSGFFRSPAARYRWTERRYDAARRLRSWGWRELNAGRPRAARACFRAALAVFSSDETARLGLIACALSEGAPKLPLLLPGTLGGRRSGDGSLYVQLGEKLESGQRAPEAEALYRKALEAYVERRDAAALLERLFASRGDRTSASAMADAALLTAVETSDAYSHLGHTCTALAGRSPCDPYRRGIALTEQALRESSSGSDAGRLAAATFARSALSYLHVMYGHYWDDAGDEAAAAAEYRASIALAPPSADAAYDWYGALLLRRRRWSEAGSLFRSAVAADPSNVIYLDRLAGFEESRGRSGPADALRRRARELRAAAGLTETDHNYLRLADAAAARGIKLLVVAYPMCRADHLRDLLHGLPSVSFVDNETPFREVVAKEGLPAVFTDMFAGSFGHCTPLGYRLLARNVADAVLASPKGPGAAASSPAPRGE